jgi:ABC-2 type transport system ATP-binding protein
MEHNASFRIQQLVDYACRTGLIAEEDRTFAINRLADAMKMSSVEEVCDHLTLINKSKNILSGSLNEIRRSHGGNIFEVEFRGNRELLVEALRPTPCEILDTTISDDEAVVESRGASLKLHIPNDEDIRSVVEVINASTSLRSFREVIPSMNDIFIRAVAGTL